jgi:hypothetical protein
VSVELHLSRTVEDDIRAGEALEPLLKPVKVLQEIFHAEDEAAIGTQLELLHHPLQTISRAGRRETGGAKERPQETRVPGHQRHIRMATDRWRSLN